nr:MAG TPA: hypothetical protein [Caudoviricetes sp.]
MLSIRCKADCALNHLRTVSVATLHPKPCVGIEPTYPFMACKTPRFRRAPYQ